MSNKSGDFDPIPPVVEGVALWYVGAWTVKNFPSMFGANATNSGFGLPVSVLAATVPFAYISARALTAINKCENSEQVFHGITLGTTVALLLDGLAHTLTPYLYNDNPTVAVRGAGWVFWGAAWFIIWGYVHSKNYPPRNSKGA